MARWIQGRRIGCWLKLVRKLLERSITSKVSLPMFQNHSGTWPWMLLVPSSSHFISSWFARKSRNLLKLHLLNPEFLNFWSIVLSLVSLIINDTPQSDRYKEVNFLSLTNLSNSTLPIKLFVERSRHSRFSRLKIELGIWPVRWLPASSKFYNFVRFVSPKGIWPLMKL